MTKSICFLLVAMCITSICFSQGKNTREINREIQEKSTDSIRDRIERYVSPTKATFFSALLPGLGQVYNKSYWKVPVVYALLYSSFRFYKYYDNRYEGYRNAYSRRLAGFTDDPYYDVDGSGVVVGKPDIDNQSLTGAQRSVKRDRDLAFVLCLLTYILNVVDASVDAHMKYYKVDFKISLKPFIRYKNFNNFDVNQVGIALNLDF